MGRPFGARAYSFGLYSRWYDVILDPLSLFGVSGIARARLVTPTLQPVSVSLGGRSRIAPVLSLQATAALPLIARSWLQAPLREFWEPVAACDVTWTVQPKPPYVCPELTDG